MGISDKIKELQKDQVIDIVEECDSFIIFKTNMISSLIKKLSNILESSDISKNSEIKISIKFDINEINSIEIKIELVPKNEIKQEDIKNNETQEYLKKYLKIMVEAAEKTASIENNKCYNLNPYVSIQQSVIKCPQ